MMISTVPLSQPVNPSLDENLAIGCDYRQLHTQKKYSIYGLTHCLAQMFQLSFQTHFKHTTANGDHLQLPTEKHTVPSSNFWGSQSAPAPASMATSISLSIINGFTYTHVNCSMHLRLNTLAQMFHLSFHTFRHTIAQIDYLNYTVEQILYLLLSFLKHALRKLTVCTNSHSNTIAKIDNLYSIATHT